MDNGLSRRRQGFKSPWGRQQGIKAPAVMQVPFSFQPLRETARAFLFETCFARASTGNWAGSGKIVWPVAEICFFEQNSRRIREARSNGGCGKQALRPAG